MNDESAVHSGIFFLIILFVQNQIVTNIANIQHFYLLNGVPQYLYCTADIYS